MAEQILQDQGISFRDPVSELIERYGLAILFNSQSVGRAGVPHIGAGDNTLPLRVGEIRRQVFALFITLFLGKVLPLIQNLELLFEAE